MALRHFLIGRAKEYFELVGAKYPGYFDRILPEIQEYANKRRLEARVKRENKEDPMDVGSVSRNTGHGQGEDDWGESSGGADFDMNSWGKGKGFLKGKGKGNGYFAPYGKGMQTAKGMKG